MGACRVPAAVERVVAVCLCWRSRRLGDGWGGSVRLGVGRPQAVAVGVVSGGGLGSKGRVCPFYANSLPTRATTTTKTEVLQLATRAGTMKVLLY